MSHYTTYVITKTDNREELDELMLPYHEYESTGITDYCVHIDTTEEALKNYEEEKDEYDSLEAFIDSWYGIHSDTVYKEEPNERPNDPFAVIKDGKLIKLYRFTNPNAKWDYYSPYDWESTEYIKDVVNKDDCETIKKSQFDIESFMQERRKYFGDLYKKLKPYFVSDFISWEQARKENSENIDKARELYNNQQSIKDMESGIGSAELFQLRWSIEIDNIATMTENEFINNNLSESAPFWALVTPDGEWIEHGHMGWFAISWNEDKEFNKTWIEAWKSIPDDYYVWRCDCHI